jgi:hypothetical protein
MAFFDEKTGEYSAAGIGYDNQGLMAGDKSLLEEAGDVITKGVPLTGLAVLNSFANTAIDVGNMLGGDIKRLEIADQVDKDYADYYKEHEQGIEGAALLGGSLIPGMAAVKALKLAQAGRMTPALQRATNIFAGPKQRIIEDAVKELEAGDGLYAQLGADKFKAIALGVGDQALQALAYEAATLATMKASPLLDKDGIGDVLDHMFWGTLVGAGVGGVLEGIGSVALLNRARAFADNSSKAQEMATRLGLGNFGAGDRVAALVESVDNIPPPTSLLGGKKLANTRQSAVMDAKLALHKLVSDGDEEVTNSMFDVLLKMKDELGMGKEEFYNYFARLQKVSRITEPTVDNTPGDIFYLNRFARSKTDVSWNDIATNAPHQDADLSLAYKLRDYATDVKIAKHTDTVELPNGQTKPRFKNSTQAWEEDYDVFWGRDNTIFVNPKAPNLERVARPGESRTLSPKEEMSYRSTGQLPKGSKPLYGAPLILNTVTGDLTTEAIPVIGDVGKVSLFDRGLMAGDRSYTYSVNQKLPTDPVEANGRYVWASLRGIKPGDSIGDGDVAMLEQVYREAQKFEGGWNEYIKQLDRRKVTIGDEMPASPDELLSRIRQAKDELVTDLLDKGESAEAISRKANVPEDYLANSLRAKAPEDYMIDPAQHAGVNHVKMEYDIGNIKMMDGQILRGMADVQYRVGLVKDVSKNAVAKFMQKFGGGAVEKYIIEGSSAEAGIGGTGPGFFSASNAQYNTLAQKAERVGRYLTRLHQILMAQISEKLAPAFNAIRNDEAAAAELGAFRAIRHRLNNERYIFLPEEFHPKAPPGMVPENLVILESSLVKDKRGVIIDWNSDYVPPGFVHGSAQQAGLKLEGNYSYYGLSGKVAAFERANQEVNDLYHIGPRNDFYAAVGSNRQLEPGSLYTPPVDTAKYPHFALVRAKRGFAMADDDVAMITAETGADLEQKIAAIDLNRYSVFTKDDLKKHHEVLGDYDYSRNFAQVRVDEMLRKRGILNNVLPDTRAETIIKDYVDWHSRQLLRTLRDHVELGNSQLFAELRAMGEKFTSAETSRTGFVQSLLKRFVANPYDSYIKQALAISEKDTYRMWADANEKLEAFGDTAFRAAKNAFLSARRGLIDFNTASDIMEQHGLGNPYKAVTDALNPSRAERAYYDVANKLPPTRIVSRFVSTANSVLATTAIRLDAFQSLINAVSTPVLLLSEANSAKQLITTELPDGSGRIVPATSKLLYNAVHNWFNSDVRDTWLPTYKEIGAVRDKSSDFFKMIDHLTLPYGKWTESAVNEQLTKAVELGAKLSGSEYSEQFGRFIAADTARQLFESAGYAGQALTDNIASFVNRVHGNYIASQRPVAFQGPLGQAIGLFQTYQFNLLQQVFRYVENGEAKTLAILAGMQTTLFGLQGLPGFQAINNHIVGNAANNPAHKDFYSTIPNLVDKKLGDYLLYGVTSNWLQTGLYSRGDINPRQITVLPVNPLDYPAIAGGIKFMGSVIDTAQKIGEGGGTVASMLLGLEHNGLSRPLSGVAQLAQGFTTTGKGALVSANRTTDGVMGFGEMFQAGNFGRLLGARPLDEAIIMDGMYRTNLYTAKNTARITELGEAVKTKMYNGQQPTEEEVEGFARNFASRGGDINTFAQHMHKWSTDANVSIANQVYQHLGRPVNQQLQIMMGGTQLPDFSTPKP